MKVYKDDFFTFKIDFIIYHVLYTYVSFTNV